MMQYSQEDIQKKYKLIPNELKSFLMSEEETDDLNDICNKHGLQNHFLSIQKNIALVCLGFSNFDDFRNYIFSISKDQNSGQIAYQQIFNMIFLPVMHLIGKEAPKKIQPTENQSPKNIPQKQIEPQDNVPFFEEKTSNNAEIESIPPAKPQNTFQQIQAIKSMDKSQIEEIKQYHQDDDMPATRRSFDSYREPIE